MKRRAKRDLLTLAGVVVILAGVVGANTYMRLEGLKEQYRAVRIALEEKYRGQGYYVINWDDMRETKGSRRSGAKFGEVLTEKDGRAVNLCGFMMPIDTFRNVTNFMLLPVPYTCYFCESPPMRDIVEVNLGKEGDLVEEPIIVGGRLALHPEPGPVFFYTINEGRWNQAVKEEDLHQQQISEDHVTHHVMGFQQIRDEGQPEKPLVPGYEPPSGGDSGLPSAAPDPDGHYPEIDLGPLVPGQEPRAAAADDTAGDGS